MSLPEINYCPGTLAEGFNTYSPAFLRRMFNGKKVSHILPYSSSQFSDDDLSVFLENRTHISISGVQEKLSILLDKNKLRLTKEGEQGTYILKPIPSDLKNVNQVPANEHLTMQIARQVYGINTAECGMIFFEDGSPAYITKRFDVKPDGLKWGTEDFAALFGASPDTTGINFKYNGSYEAAAALIVRYVPAWRIEVEKYFALIVFNYLFSNGDAHLKNFSLLETPNNDYILSPAYDLINTRLHVDDSPFALDKGLFKDDFKSDVFVKRNYRGNEDFIEFARRIGIAEKRISKLLKPFFEKQAAVEKLTSRSFLTQKNKRGYVMEYFARLNKLNS
jgi:serine/threonine-protein kinase HipA